MAIEVGKKYYFIVHAYHHILGEVVSIEGKKDCTLNNVIRIYSCSRGWTDFFKEGCKNDTNYEVFPDGTEVSGWCLAAPWSHSIPKEK